MITCVPYNYDTKADEKRDCSLGNILFAIAGCIGVAVKNGYEYGFRPWINQEYFINPLPNVKNQIFKPYQIQPNYQGFDIGFRGFDIPDNTRISGCFGSEKYWQHCEEKIRFYFEMKPICEPIKDTIIVHYRNYNLPAWYALDHNYYHAALKKLPEKKILIVTDNIDAAYKAIKIQCDYTSNAPIIDFFLLSHADYLIMGNSSFSWMGAYLSQAMTVAPVNWYAGPFWDCPTESNYLKNWIKC